MISFAHSMRWRLQLWHMLVIVMLVTGLLTLFYYHEKLSRLKSLDDSLQLPMIQIAPDYFGSLRHKLEAKKSERDILRQLGVPEPTRDKWKEGKNKIPYEVRDQAGTIAEAALHELEQAGFFAVIWSGDGKVLHASESAALHSEAPNIEMALGKPFLRWHDNHREAIIKGSYGSIILIGYPAAQLNAGLRDLRYSLISAGVIILISCAAIGWWLNWLALKPIKEMSDTAKEIASGDLSNRIKTTSSRNELGDLADTLNVTFERLETALERQIQFTADASHELRTPLTIILNEIHWALEKIRSSEDYTDSLETCQTSALHMKSLIESLLELAKIDAGDQPLQKEEIKLDNLLEETLNTLRPIAAQRSVKLNLETAPLVAHGNKTQIRQVIFNLISNAIHHTPIESNVHVSMETREDWHVVTVRDDGGGIEETNIPFIFDRMYRTNSARAKTSGSGLGLAISKAIAIAHGGDLRVVSPEGEGCEFTFMLPI